MAYWFTIRQQRKRLVRLHDKISSCYAAQVRAKQENDREHVCLLDTHIAAYRQEILYTRRDIRELEAGHWPSRLVQY